MLVPRRKAAYPSIESVDNAAQVIVTAVVRLADNADNIAKLSKLTAALDGLMRGSDVYPLMKTSLYSLDEYIDIKHTKLKGKAVNEEYLAQLKEDLLNARI